MDTLEDTSELQRALDHFDDTVSTADSFQTVTEQVVAQGGIDQTTVVTIESVCPAVITTQYHLNSFTRSLSRVNYDVALESLSSSIADITRRVWEALKRAVHTLIEWVTKAYHWIMDAVRGNREDAAAITATERATHDLLLALPAPYRSTAQRAVDKAISLGDNYCERLGQMRRLSTQLTVATMHNQRPYLCFKAATKATESLIGIADRRMEHVYKLMSSYRYHSVKDDYQLSLEVTKGEGFDRHDFESLIELTDQRSDAPQGTSDGSSPGAWFIKSRNLIMSYHRDTMISPGALTVESILRMDWVGITEQCGKQKAPIAALHGLLLSQDIALSHIQVTTQLLATALRKIARTIREDIEGLQAQLESEAIFARMSVAAMQLRRMYTTHLFYTAADATRGRSNVEVERIVDEHVDRLNRTLKQLY